MENARLEQIGKFLDTMMTLPVHFGYLKGDIIGRMYHRCKQLQRGENTSLSLFAARDILSQIKENDHVLILTGWPIWPYGPVGEMDGPPGAVVLARAIARCRKASAIFVVEEQLNEVMQAACRYVGLSILDLKTAMTSSGAAAIVNYPTHAKTSTEAAAEILDKTTPSYVIAIERPGRNEKGEYHTRWGANVSQGVDRLDDLFPEARRRGIRTLGIGDAGNELGMGCLRETLLELFPEGKVCKCSCGGSIAGIDEADVSFIATVCNWGAYAITGGMAALAGDSSILHDGDTEKGLLGRCAEKGAIDTTIMAPSPTPEGLSTAFHSAWVDIVRQVVAKGISGSGGL